MDKIDEFFEKRLITKRGTKKSYRSFINRYFKIIGKTPDQYFTNGYTHEEFEKDLMKAYHALKDIPPLTQKAIFNSVKQFMGVHDKTLKTLDIWDTISVRLRGSMRTKEEKVPDAQELKQILQYADVKGRAIFLIMASTGCRIGELLSLLPQDVHPDEKPPRIRFRGKTTRTGKQRTSFMSNEAADAYRAWMTIRDEYLVNAVAKSTLYPKDIDDPRVFPMNYNTVKAIWKNMLRKAKMDDEEKIGDYNFLLIHFHCLRKFFRSYFGNADLAEHLMGHSGYLSTYRQMNDKQLAKEYLKHMGNVSIFETTSNENIKRLNERLTEKDEEIFNLKTEMKVLMERQERLEMLDNRFARILEDKDVQKLLIHKLKKIA